MILPPDLLVKTQYAKKGSYRQENILLWMQRWLEPWTPQRALRRDHRILMLDMAKSHLGDAVVEFAWGRGPHFWAEWFVGAALASGPVLAKGRLGTRTPITGWGFGCPGRHHLSYGGVASLPVGATLNSIAQKP